MAQQPLVSRRLFINRAFVITLRHTILCIIPLPYAETSYDSQGTDIHAPGGIRTRNPNQRAAENPHLKDNGHWDRRNVTWLQTFDHSSTSVPNDVYELKTVVGVKMAVPFPARSAICYQLLLARSTRRCRMNN